MIKPFRFSKSYIVTLILLFSRQISYSQTDFTVGVKGGVIFNQYIISSQGMTNIGTDYHKGLAIGLTSQLFKSKYFMLIPEIYYLQRGMSYKGNDYVLSRSAGKTSVSYLSFMALPAFRYVNKFLIPCIFAGPRIELRLNYDDRELPNFYNFLNNTNIGFTAGIGFEKEITKSINITADFRYCRDFTDFKSVFTIDGQFANYTNSSFDILAGVNFKIGSKK